MYKDVGQWNVLDVFENLARVRTLHLISFLERGFTYIYLDWAKEHVCISYFCYILPRNQTIWFLFNTLFKGNPVQVLWTECVCPAQIHMLKP